MEIKTHTQITGTDENLYKIDQIKPKINTKIKKVDFARPEMHGKTRFQKRTKKFKNNYKSDPKTRKSNFFQINAKNIEK